MRNFHPESLVTSVPSVSLDITAVIETLLMDTSLSLSFQVRTFLTAVQRRSELVFLTPCHAEHLEVNSRESICSSLGKKLPGAMNW